MANTSKSILTTGSSNGIICSDEVRFPENALNVSDGTHHITNPDLTVIGNLEVNGNIILSGSIVPKEEEKMEQTQVNHDIEINVVDNGFSATIGNRSYVFSDLDELDKWINENFKTPKAGREHINSIKCDPTRDKQLYGGWDIGNQKDWNITQTPAHNTTSSPFVNLPYTNTTTSGDETAAGSVWRSLIGKVKGGK